MEALESRILLAGDGLLDPLAPSRSETTGSDAVEVVTLGADSVTTASPLETNVAARNPITDLFEGVGDDWGAAESVGQTPAPAAALEGDRGLAGCGLLATATR